MTWNRDDDEYSREQNYRDETRTDAMKRNEHISEPIRSIVNAAAPSIRPLVERTCWMCAGSGICENGMVPGTQIGNTSFCRICAGKGYYLVESDEETAKRKS